ncbi:unnamed protein product, partial [marine sediment metagenome]
PTFVSGEIIKDTVWYAGASPYVIEDDIHVRSKATLTIEPGVRIESKGGPLIIQGQLQALGDKDGSPCYRYYAAGCPYGTILYRSRA